MKKVIICIISITIIMANNIYAEWIYSNIASGWLYRDESQNKLITNSWHLIKVKDDIKRFYYFNENGFLLTNCITPDGKQVNENGELIINGIIQDIKEEVKEENKEGTNVEDSTNIIYAQQGKSSGRLLKNFILEAQNVELVSEKSINGTKKNNVLYFKQNGSFISIDTKKYNKVLIKAERDKSSKDYEYEIQLVVNGEIEDSISFEDEQYELEYEFSYSINDDVDIVLNTDAQTSSWSSKGLYITNGRMSKYKENEE